VGPWLCGDVAAMVCCPVAKRPYGNLLDRTVLYPEDPDGSPHPSREKSKTEELIFTLLN